MAEVTVCAVCGRSLSAKEAATREHEGHLYYLCSDECRAHFMSEPQAFTVAGHHLVHTTVAIPIYGLDWSAGEHIAIERVLARLPGVTEAYVNPAVEAAYVSYSPRLIARETLIEKIEDLGYTAGRPQEVQ